MQYLGLGAWILPKSTDWHSQQRKEVSQDDPQEPSLWFIIFLFPGRQTPSKVAVRRRSGEDGGQGMTATLTLRIWPSKRERTENILQPFISPWTATLIHPVNPGLEGGEKVGGEVVGSHHHHVNVVRRVSSGYKTVEIYNFCSLSLPLFLIHPTPHERWWRESLSYQVWLGRIFFWSSFSLFCLVFEYSRMFDQRF